MFLFHPETVNKKGGTGVGEGEIHQYSAIACHLSSRPCILAEEEKEEYVKRKKEEDRFKKR